MRVVRHPRVLQRRVRIVLARDRHLAAHERRRRRVDVRVPAGHREEVQLDENHAARPGRRTTRSVQRSTGLIARRAARAARRGPRRSADARRARAGTTRPPARRACRGRRRRGAAPASRASIMKRVGRGAVHQVVRERGAGEHARRDRQRRVGQARRRRVDDDVERLVAERRRTTRASIARGANAGRERRGLRAGRAATIVTRATPASNSGADHAARRPAGAGEQHARAARASVARRAAVAGPRRAPRRRCCRRRRCRRRHRSDVDRAGERRAPADARRRTARTPSTLNGTVTLRPRPPSAKKRSIVATKPSSGASMRS